LPAGPERVSQKKDIVYTLWLLRLPAGMARHVMTRLKFPAALSRVILAARQLWADLSGLIDAPPSKVVDRLESVPLPAIYAVYLACDQPEQRSVLWNYAARWRQVSSTLSGHDLRARGLAPGPAYKEILKKLRNAWLDGDVSTMEQEAKLLETLIAGQRTGDR